MTLLYDTLVQGWNGWLEEEASAIDIEGGWRRKNIHSLLKTREPQEEPDGDDAVDEGQDGDEGELIACYDSDGDDGFIAPNARGGQRWTLGADIEDEGEGEGEGTIVNSNNNRKYGDEDDEDEDEDGDIVDGNNNRKRGHEHDEEDEDEDGDKDEEGEEQEKEKEQWKGGNRGANAGNKRKRGETTGMGRKSCAKKY